MWMFFELKFRQVLSSFHLLTCLCFIDWQKAWFWCLVKNSALNFMVSDWCRLRYLFISEGDVSRSMWSVSALSDWLTGPGLWSIIRLVCLRMLLYRVAERLLLMIDFKKGDIMNREFLPAGDKVFLLIFDEYWALAWIGIGDSESNSPVRLIPFYSSSSSSSSFSLISLFAYSSTNSLLLLGRSLALGTAI